MRPSRIRTTTGAAAAAAALGLATLAPFATTAASARAASDLRYDRAETFVAVDAGKAATATATCPSGFVAVNGGFQVDADSAGEAADLVVGSSNQNAGNSRQWTATVSNGSDARVTGRVRATCLGATTAGGQALGFSKAESGAIAFADGYADATATCASGVPIGSGWALTGDAYLIASAPSGSGWKHSFESAGASSVTSTAYCVGTTAGSGATAVTVGHVPDADVAAKATTVADGRPADTTSSCPEGSVAVAGSFAELEAGVYALGAESAGRDMRQRFYNDSGASSTLTTDVVCLTSSAVAPAEPTIREDDNKVYSVGTGARAKVSAFVICSSACGTVTGKLFVKKADGSKGARLATGKVTYDATKPAAELLMRKKGSWSGTTSGILVLSGKGVSSTQTVTIDLP